MTKKATPSPFQARCSILEKLKNLGIRTEKDIQKLQIEQLVMQDDITIIDLRDILAVQSACKSGQLFSWLLADACPECKEDHHEQ